MSVPPLVALAVRSEMAEALVGVFGGTATSSAPAPPSGTLPALTLTPSQTNANGPWTFGHPFSQGAVPSGTYITASSGASAIQADVRNLWPDGSVKYALLSGISPFISGQPIAVQLSTTQTAPSGSLVAEPSNIANTNIVFTKNGGQYPISATVTCDINAVLGTKQGTWSNGVQTAWGSPTSSGLVRQVLGTVMSQFHYWQYSGYGQLGVWWFVRAYSTGAIEVEYVVENGWLGLSGTVVAPSQVDYGVTVTIGGSVAYSSLQISSDMPASSIAGNTATTISYNADLRAQIEQSGQSGYFFVNGNPLTLFQTTAVSYDGGTNVTTLTVSGGLPTVTSLSVCGHFSHTKWGGVAWVSGGAPVTPQHNAAYLLSTKLVPNYGYTSPTVAAYTSYVTALNPVPFALGNWTFTMGDTGAQGAIGLLPLWESLYCTAAASQAYIATISNNRGSGRWGIHYRDEATGRPFDYRTYPTICFNGGGQGATGTPPVASGGSQSSWDVPHHPSNGYLAYLIEGRWSQLEALQFAASYNILFATPATRTANGYQGVLSCWNSPLTTRGAAWAWRTAAQVACVSPTRLMGSATPAVDLNLQTAFAKSIDDTANWSYAEYVSGSQNSGATKNSIGWLGQYDQYSSPANQFWGSGWMVGFQQMSLCHACELSIENLAAPNALSAIRNFLLRSTLQMIGIDNTYWNYRRAGVYARPYLNSSVPSPSGSPQFMTAQQAFSAFLSYIGLSSTLSASAGNTLKQHGSETDVATNIQDSSNTGNGYWAQVTAGIEMGADAGVAGCRAALELLSQAPNWLPPRPDTDNSPQFALLPRTAITKPSWWNSLAPLTWYLFPSSDANSQVMSSYPLPGGSGQKNFICSYSGGCFDAVGNRLIIFGGGHADYGGNEVLAFDPIAGKWSLLRAPTQGIGSSGSQVPASGNPYYPDGRPSARHTYGTVLSIPEFDGLMTFGGSAWWGNGNGGGPQIDRFNYATGDWDPAGTWTGLTSTSSNPSETALRDFIGNVWIMGEATGKVYRWNLANAQTASPWDTFTPLGGATINEECPFVYDPKRHVIFRFPVTGTGAGWYDCANSSAFTAVTLGDPNGYLTNCSSWSAEYCPDRDSYVVLARGSLALYEVNPQTWAVSQLTVSGTAPSTEDGGLPGYGTNYYWGRFRYVPALRGFILMTSTLYNVGFFRTG